MAKFYVIPTDYGLEQIAQTHDNRTIQLKNLILGDANGLPYFPLENKHRTTLVNECASVPIQNINIINNVIRVITTIPSHIGGFNIHEIGLTDQTGKLVYIGNYHGGYKPIVTEGAGGELILYIDIKPEQGANALIEVSEGIHFLRLILETFYHIGSWHGTDNLNYNPSKALEPFFGYPTRWELRPHVPLGVLTEADPVLQEFNISGSDITKASSTRIWKRLPDHDPTYQLTTSQNGVDEGEEITFLLQTEHLQAGDKIGWQLSIDTGTFSVSPNQLSGFFVIDENGQASHTLTVNTASTTNQKLRMSLFGTSHYIDVPIFKPRFSNGLLSVLVDQNPNPTTYYDHRFWSISIHYFDMDLHVGEEVTVNLSGSAVPYLYEASGYVSGNPLEESDDPQAQSSYTDVIREVVPPSNIRYLFGIFGMPIYVKASAPTNLILTAELVWRGEVVGTRTVTMHMPEN